MQDLSPGGGAAAAVQTVHEITLALKRVVESGFGDVAVEGEVSNAKRASSGHLYFNLRDPDAVMPCVMWRTAAQRLDRPLQDGQKVVARGDVQIYAPHGRYQLVVREVRAAGLGELLVRLEQLKQRLAGEGLFAPERKRPLPYMPRRVGVVTAETGAALRDILTTLHQRFPARVLLYPAKVQGAGAAEAVARGIAALGAVEDVDVLIVGRGGGSIEDLWAFNEEVVARAIAACPKPVVSAVGHETDTLLSDLVADLRAATPTAAAERVVPSLRDLRAGLDEAARRMARSLRRRLDHARTTVAHARARLADPRRLVAERRQRVDDLEARAEAVLRRRLAASRERRAHLGGRLRNLHPRERLRSARSSLAGLERRLHAAGAASLHARRRRLAEARHTLAVLSPLASLERGYAIVRDAEGRVVRAAGGVAPGAGLEVLLWRGALDVRVEAARPRHPFEPEEP